jgi:hypothetical protein
LSIAILALAAAGAAVGHSAKTNANASGDSPSAAELLAATPHGPGRRLESFGVTAANAVPVLTLTNGEEIGLLLSSYGKCIVRSNPQHVMGELCSTTAELGSANAITVADECGAKTNNRMKIYGLAAEQAAAARLLYSDASSEPVQVAGGAFAFESENPKPGARYPNGLQWLDAQGGPLGTVELPVGGDNFCPGG